MAVESAWRRRRGSVAQGGPARLGTFVPDGSFGPRSSADLEDRIEDGAQLLALDPKRHAAGLVQIGTEGSDQWQAAAYEDCNVTIRGSARKRPAPIGESP